MNRIVLLLIIAVPLLTHAQSNDAPLTETPSTLVVPAPRRTLRVVEGESPPPGYHLGSRPRLSLIISGGATFLAAYGPTALYGVGTSLLTSIACAVVGACDFRGWLGIVPIAGPILISEYAGIPLGLGIAGSAVQLAGAATLIAGFLFPEPVWVLNRRHAPAVTMSITGAGVQAQF